MHLLASQPLLHSRQRLEQGGPWVYSPNHENHPETRPCGTFPPRHWGHSGAHRPSIPPRGRHATAVQAIAASHHFLAAHTAASLRVYVRNYSPGDFPANVRPSFCSGTFQASVLAQEPVVERHRDSAAYLGFFGPWRSNGIDPLT